jgi:hypothetical protein
MKKNLFLLFFAAIMTISNSIAQITQEHNYSASATLTEMAVSGYKYFLMDVTNNQCRIYNLDHSIWKTINLNVPSGMYLYDIRYVSETLFNTDNKVELAYIYYSYDTTLLYYTYYTKIINEDGTQLLSIPGCAYVDVITAGSHGTKLMAYVYDYSIVLWTLNTLVYSLPGNLFAGESQIETGNVNRHPYPNPSQSFINIPYSLPAGAENGQLQIINTSGHVLKTYRLRPDVDKLLVPLNDLPAGGYFYQVKTSHEIMSSGSFIHE